MWQGLAEVFAARGHEVTIIPRRYPTQPDDEVVRGVRYRRVSGFSQSRSIAVSLLKDLAYAISVVRRLPESDILVVNDFWLPLFAGWLRRGAGLIVISANRFPKGQYALYGRATRIVAASRVIEQAIADQTPAAAGRIRCIPNPLDTSAFVPPPSWRAGRSSKTILYLGRLHPEKAVDILVSAFARIAPSHPEASLRIVGPSRASQGGGGEAYLENLRKLAGKAPVSFTGPEFDVNRLVEIYQEADLFCYPTTAERGEALPVAPLEAMSTGLPVIVSSLECFRDFIVEGETGVCFDHRCLDPVGALAAKLDDTLFQWPRTLEIGRRAWAAAQHFGFEQVAGEFLDDFATLLATK